MDSSTIYGKNPPCLSSTAEGHLREAARRDFQRCLGGDVYTYDIEIGYYK